MSLALVSNMVDIYLACYPFNLSSLGEEYYEALIFIINYEDNNYYIKYISMSLKGLRVLEF